MAQRDTSPNSETQAYLPDFCSAGSVFVVVLFSELVAIVLTLAAYDSAETFLVELARTSLFVVWLGLLSAIVMCGFRDRLESAGKTQAFVLSFIVLLLMCLLLAEVAWQITRKWGESVIIDDSHGGFLMRTFAISAIVIALAMRYLYIASEWRRSIVLEAQARISALQALIRPHFLFNSMNTIASLTRTDPQQAEEAVEDLSDLLRANLGGSGNRTTLKEELEVAAIYQRIEKLRLGDRLSVRWKVDDLPMRALIPSLVIQPLLENAIYHGIELLPDGGEVVVTGSRDDDHLAITITNPVAAGKARSKDGNNMAMANIRQRFELAYEAGATVDVDDSNNQFTVSLRFPHEERQS
ncbi:MAG: sensor histidine kinase [Pseudomonadota bacterium]